MVRTGWWPFARKQRFDPVVWTTDLERIKRLYECHGYHQAEVMRAQAATPHPPQGVDLQVELRKGPATRVLSLEIKGLEELPDTRRLALAAELLLTVGGIFEEKN